ncbi:hypothetical protein MMA231_01853 [Asticcacaulis sp. MM231]|uniref:DUF2059 domain-containing protein n=1 Tax=Asticcacaulis sp. MM231 TaxID=3157666 RepID=UPI0032D5872A
MRKFVICLASVSLLAVMPVAAMAQNSATPAVEDAVTARKVVLIKRYFKSIEMDKLIGSMMQSMLPALAEQQRASSGLTSEQSKMVTDAAVETMAEITPIYIDKLSVIYADAFTEDELVQMVAFYESPVGQSITKKTPTLIPKTTQVMMELMPEIQNRMQTKMCKKIDCSAGKAK